MKPPFRVSRPANQSQRENAVDWGVYDSRTAKLVTKSEYTQAFAKILASAMNFAFKEGLKGDIWRS